MEPPYFPETRRPLQLMDGRGRGDQLTIIICFHAPPIGYPTRPAAVLVIGNNVTPWKVGSEEKGQKQK